jgi:ubiquinone/menaquinone biosynthesis C-methylase UbiE
MITEKNSIVLKENIQKTLNISSVPFNLRLKFQADSKKNHKYPNKFLIPINRIIEFLSPLEGSTIIDVGCRYGSYLIELSNLGMNVIGVDIVLGWIKILKERSKELGLKVDCVVGDGTRLPFKDDVVDGVIAMQYFTHVRDFDPALSELIRILRSNGKLMIIDRTLAFLSFIRLFRVGGMKWLTRKSRSRLLGSYGGKYIGKDEDVHSFQWWKKKLINPNLKNLKIHSSGSLKKDILNWILHFIIGSIWVFCQKR